MSGESVSLGVPVALPSTWITGEAELGTLRRADGWIVNKHYDLASADDLGTALDEVAALIADSSVPHGALTAREQRSQ